MSASVDLPGAVALPTTGGATVQESPQEAARRIREDAERRAQRHAPAERARAGVPGRPQPDPMPTGWSRLRSRRLSGTTVLVGPGGVVVVAEDRATLAEATASVRAACGPHGVVTPVLLVAGPDAPDPDAPDPDAPEPVDLPAGTESCSAAQLGRVVASRPRLLGPGQVAELQIRLEARLAAGAQPAVAGPAPAGPPTAARLVVRVLLILLVLLAVAVLAAVGTTVGLRLG